MQYLYRNATNDYRFSLPQLAQALAMPRPNATATRAALSAMAIQHGATYIGKARVGLPGGGQVFKDNVYAVPAAHWAAWWAAMRRLPTAPSPAPSPAPHLAVYGTKEQLIAVQAACQALGAQCVIKS